MKIFFANYWRKAAAVMAAFFLLFFVSGCSLGQSKPNLTSIDDIYKQWKTYKNLSYELRVVQHGGEAATQDQGAVKFSTKGLDRSRIEVVTNGEPSVMIYNAQKKLNILYYPNSKQFINTGFDEKSGSKVNLGQEIDDFYSQIKDGYKIIGHEEIAGQPALVLDGPADSNDKQKVWVSAETALPLKLQTFDAAGKVVDDYEFVNHSTGELPDELFEQPADATEVSFAEFLKKWMPEATDPAAAQATDGQEQTTSGTNEQNIK